MLINVYFSSHSSGRTLYPVRVFYLECLPCQRQVDERHAYLCAAAPLKEDMEYIRSALLTASFKVRTRFEHEIDFPG